MHEEQIQPEKKHNDLTEALKRLVGATVKGIAVADYISIGFENGKQLKIQAPGGGRLIYEVLDEDDI